MKNRACPYCQKELPQDAAFCPKCGKDVKNRTCPHCRKELPPDAVFCLKCGKEVISAAAPALTPRGRKPLSRKANIILWTLIAILNLAIFVIALTQKSWAGIYYVYIVFGVIAIWLGLVMLLVNLFKKVILKRLSTGLKRWGTVVLMGLVFSIMGGIVQKVNSGQTTPDFKTATNALISNIDIPEGSRIYGLGAPFSPGKDLSIQPDFGNTISFRTELHTYFFFIDDAPTMRFAHPVRYVLFESREKGGFQWKIYTMEWLPTVNGQDWEIQERITVKGKQVTVLRESGKTRASPAFEQAALQTAWYISSEPRGFLTFARKHILLWQIASAQAGSKRIAIVIDGSDKPKKYDEEMAKQFAGDAEGISSRLRDLGYDTKLYSGYKGNSLASIDSFDLASQIGKIASEARPGDEVALYLGGHGNRDGFAIYTKQGQRDFLEYAELANWLKNLDPQVKLQLVIDSCKSGGAFEHLKDRPNTTIITATDDKNLAPAGIGAEKSFTESAQEGFQGKATDANKNGKIDVEEAFSYAKSQHKNGSFVVNITPRPPTTPTPTPTPTRTTPTPSPTPSPATGAKPDLTVTAVSFSPSSGKAGQSLSVTLTIKNQGGSGSGPFSNRISLATTRYGTNYSLGNFAMEPLPAGASRTVTLTANAIPSSVSQGSYWVTVFTDGFQQVAESDENNNINSPDAPNKFSLSVATPTPVSSPKPVSGTWKGQAVLTTSVTGAACRFGGDITLSLTQTGETLRGTITYDLGADPNNSRVRCPATRVYGTAPITGTIKGSRDGGSVRFSFTTTPPFAGFTINASGLVMFGAFIEGDFTGDATGKFHVEPL